MIIQETKKKNYFYLRQLVQDPQFWIGDAIAQDLQGKSALHYLMRSKY